MTDQKCVNYMTAHNIDLKQKQGLTLKYLIRFSESVHESLLSIQND